MFKAGIDQGTEKLLVLAECFCLGDHLVGNIAVAALYNRKSQSAISVRMI